MDKKYVVLLVVALFPVVLLANNCPTHLTKSHDGSWVSDEAPGWQSAELTGPETKINVKDFGGAVYSPTKKRLACVYRTNQGYYIAMVSHIHKGFQINPHKRGRAGKLAAWQWDNTHHDFTCGKPDVLSAAKCEFTINN